MTVEQGHEINFVNAENALLGSIPWQKRLTVVLGKIPEQAIWLPEEITEELIDAIINQVAAIEMGDYTAPRDAVSRSVDLLEVGLHYDSSCFISGGQLIVGLFGIKIRFELHLDENFEDDCHDDDPNSPRPGGRRIAQRTSSDFVRNLIARYKEASFSGRQDAFKVTNQIISTFYNFLADCESAGTAGLPDARTYFIADGQHRRNVLSHLIDCRLNCNDVLLVQNLCALPVAMMNDYIFGPAIGTGDLGWSDDMFFLKRIIGHSGREGDAVAAETIGRRRLALENHQLHNAIFGTGFHSQWSEGSFLVSGLIDGDSDDVPTGAEENTGVFKKVDIMITAAYDCTYIAAIIGNVHGQLDDRLFVMDELLVPKEGVSTGDKYAIRKGANGTFVRVGGNVPSDNFSSSFVVDREQIMLSSWTYDDYRHGGEHDNAGFGECVGRPSEHIDTDISIFGGYDDISSRAARIDPMKNPISNAPILIAGWHPILSERFDDSCGQCGVRAHDKQKRSVVMIYDGAIAAVPVIRSPPQRPCVTYH